jgi:hypothetical protein
VLGGDGGATRPDLAGWQREATRSGGARCWPRISGGHAVGCAKLGMLLLLLGFSREVVAKVVGRGSVVWYGLSLRVGGGASSSRS